MIYKYIRKKCCQLGIEEQSKSKCIDIIEKYASKKNNRLQQLRKSDIIIKICQKLIKFIQGIQQTQIEDGLVLLQLIKGLTMQIYQNNRIEAYLIKIRAYLLTIRWNKIKNIPLDKQISRIHLFLEQLKTTPIYEVISSDYYSQIERLYLELIQYKIRNNELEQSTRLINICFQSFKNQIAIICNIFNIEDNKVNRLINIKLQLLGILFKFQHGLRFVTNIYTAKEVTDQIVPKYQKITLKIPITHFPTPTLVADCESMWSSNRGARTIRLTSLSTQKINSKTMSKFHIKVVKQNNRQSIKQTVQYLNDFFNKRSHSAYLQSQQPQTQQKIVVRLPQVRKKSFFQMEKRKEGVVCEPKKKILGDSQNTSKKEANQLCVNKFKLVINMERQARDKIRKSDPFQGMSSEQLNMLGGLQKGLGNSLVLIQ